MSESHDRNCASRWNASSECDCGADLVNAEQAIHTLESVSRALEARVAKLEIELDQFVQSAQHSKDYYESAVYRILRLEAALTRLSKEAPIGDYVADIYSELSNALLIEELDQRRCLAIEALNG